MNCTHQYVEEACRVQVAHVACSDGQKQLFVMSSEASCVGQWQQ